MYSYSKTLLKFGRAAINGSGGLVSSSVRKVLAEFRQNLFLRHSSSKYFDYRNDVDGSDGIDGDDNFENHRTNRPHRRYFEHRTQQRHNSRPWNDHGGPPRHRRPYRDVDAEDWEFDGQRFGPRRGGSRDRDVGLESQDEWEYDGQRFGPRRDGSRHRDVGPEDWEFDGQRFGPRRDRDFGSPLGSRLKSVDWSSHQLEAVEKNFYVEHPAVKEMSEEELSSFYKTHDIAVSGDDKVRPILNFSHANFPDEVNSYVSGLAWSAPTPVQSLGWPIALSGKNMVGIAQTGSGKTLGFVLPALVHVKHQRKVARGEGPVVLVLAPTRELAQQIKSVCIQFGRIMGVRSTAIFGGQSKTVQARHLSEGPEIVVATPGRLLDFLESEVTTLERTTYLVLDEADRMLDMGFEPQIRKILSQVRPDRQILMWSATWPQEIRQLARDFLGSDFTQVNIGSSQLVANPNIQQNITVCSRQDKFHLLQDELRESPDGVLKTLIFVQTKSSADLLTRRLRRTGFNAMSIHGDKSQRARDITLHSFKRGESDILVATDVASRGLDVNDIELVVNYDYPNTADDYIHRIGRTARAEKSGKALTFITEDESDKAKDLISVLRNAQQTVPEDLQELADMHIYSRKKSKSSGHRQYNKPRYGYSDRRYPSRHYY